MLAIYPRVGAVHAVLLPICGNVPESCDLDFVLPQRTLSARMEEKTQVEFGHKIRDFVTSIMSKNVKVKVSPVSPDQL